MNWIRRLYRWLSGNVTCVKCGGRFYILSFGCWEGLCPRCYAGEDPWLWRVSC